MCNRSHVKENGNQTAGISLSGHFSQVLWSWVSGMSNLELLSKVKLSVRANKARAWHKKFNCWLTVSLPFTSLFPLQPPRAHTETRSLWQLVNNLCSYKMTGSPPAFSFSDCLINSRVAGNEFGRNWAGTKASGIGVFPLHCWSAVDLHTLGGPPESPRSSWIGC